MQTRVAGIDLRSFRDFAEEPLEVLDGHKEAEEKVNEKLAAKKEESSREGGRPPSALLLLPGLFVYFQHLTLYKNGKLLAFVCGISTAT